MRQRTNLACPGEATFHTNLQSGQNQTSWHRFLASNVMAGNVVESMKVAVVPPFVVYDGFDEDLLAEE
eukprot:6719047-Ditylum_brightwellii.AAC.1